MKTKRKLLVISPSFVVAYLIGEHLLKYYQIVAPVVEIYAGRNHQYFLIFSTISYFTLAMQVVYIILALKYFSEIENLLVVIVLNFIISVVTVNMSIALFNLLLFSTL